MSLEVDDIKVGMYVSVLEHTGQRMVHGGLFSDAPPVMVKNQDRSYIGDVLMVMGISLPFIAVQKVGLGGRDWATQIDTRVTTLTRLHPSYVEAMTRKPKYED